MYAKLISLNKYRAQFFILEGVNMHLEKKKRQSEFNEECQHAETSIDDFRKGLKEERTRLFANLSLKILQQ